MLAPPIILLIVLGTTIALLIFLIARPSAMASRGGKILGSVVFFALPIVCASWGATEHLERSKQTTFCLSCHIMEPYGQSLYADDPAYVPAAHFQNHRIPPDQACYTCHTDYAMYGPLRVKLHGLRHVYVQYFGTPKKPIQLYDPYNNRECLHCHAGARSFENEIHMAILDQLKSNQISCVTSGCHDTIHSVESLDKVKVWRPKE
jgi:nitrate/TMAO reductase-like tetraheme cytochrome c subunit